MTSESRADGDTRTDGVEGDTRTDGTDGDARTDGVGGARADADLARAEVAAAFDTDDAVDGVAYELETYERLLERLAGAGYEFVGFDGAIEDGEIAIRHDVDLSVERALEMAELEASLGVESTYCFLVTAPAYDLLRPVNRRRLQQIVDAGHDVGLHFDPHHYWDEEPDRDELTETVAADRACLDALVDEPVTAVSVHVPPEWALDVDFEGFESTYRPAYFSEIDYVSDSSQKWRDERPFTDGVPDALQLLVHPGLWHPSDRPLAEVVDDVRDRRSSVVDAYLHDIGE